MSDTDQLFRVHATQIGDVFQLQLDCNGCRAKEKRISALEEENEKLKAALKPLVESWQIDRHVNAYELEVLELYESLQGESE